MTDPKFKLGDLVQVRVHTDEFFDSNPAVDHDGQIGVYVRWNGNRNTNYPYGIQFQDGVIAWYDISELYEVTDG